MDDRSFDLLMARLDSQDEQLAAIKKEIENLKRRASMWGAVTGTLTALATGWLGR